MLLTMLNDWWFLIFQQKCYEKNVQTSAHWPVSADNNDFASFANDVCGLAYVHLQRIDQQF